MRVGLKSLFEDYPEIDIVAEAESGKEALEKVRAYKPDVVLMDMACPTLAELKRLRKS